MSKVAYNIMIFATLELNRGVRLLEGEVFFLTLSYVKICVSIQNNPWLARTEIIRGNHVVFSILRAKIK